jgi:hypothetical protein
MSNARSRGGHAHIQAFGGLGLYAPKLFAAIDSLGGRSSLISAGGVDLNQTVVHRTRTLRVKDVTCTSPSRDQVKQALGNRGEIRIARETQRDWEDLLFYLSDTLLASQLPANVHGAQVAALIGCRTGHWLPFELCMRRQKKSDPSLTIVPISNISAQYDQRLAASEGLENFGRLEKQGIINPPFLFDNDGPYSQKHTEARQDVALAKSLAALICGSSLMLRNRAMAEVSDTLAKNSHFAAISTASMPVQGYTETVSEKITRLFSPKKRRINFTTESHLVRQAELALEAALTDPDAQTMADAPRLGTPMHASFIIPLALTPQTREPWERLTSRIQQAIRTWGTVSAFYVAGNGAPHPGHIGRSWLQCSVYYSLPNEPTIPLPAEHEDDQTPEPRKARVLSAEAPAARIKDFLPSSFSRNGQ